LNSIAWRSIDNRIHLLKGDAEALIPALAKKRIEIIVMGTVIRTGIAGFIVGNTAENILQRVDCSVLTVKPDGFVSGKRDGERGTLVLKHFDRSEIFSYTGSMPRQPRLDAPGALHHVMARGIERKRIFKNKLDKEDFLKRLAELCDAESLAVYAWVLMPNHALC
jgi:hypothetical protein